MEPKAKPSGRGKILEILERHPQGLSGAKIAKLVTEEYAIDDHSLKGAVSKLLREKKITHDGKQECPCCCFPAVLYRINPRKVS